MTQPFISFGFTAGVLAPSFIQRGDIEKFDLGMRYGHNMIVDYRGGVAVRPPLEFKAFLSHSSTDQERIIPFQFNQQDGNTYLLVFSDYKLHIMQDGNFITDGKVTVAGDSEVGGNTLFNSPSHGLSTGDIVYINHVTETLRYLDGYEFYVEKDDADNFYLKTALDAAGYYLDLSHHTSGLVDSVAPLYEVVSPYAEADLDDLVFSQFRDEIRITSTSYTPRKLIRNADSTWSFEEIEFIGNRDAPGAPTIGPSKENGSGGGTNYNPDNDPQEAGALYAVTAVNADGEESYLADIGYGTGLIDITASAGSIRVSWSPYNPSG